MQFSANTRYDARLRSLLQKCARRGASDLIAVVAQRLLEKGDNAWLHSRVKVILFEECWTLAAQIQPKDFNDPIALLTKVCQSVKYKDAAGLGSLGYALSEGDRSSLANIENKRPVKIVSEAISRPNDFFNWVELQCASNDSHNTVLCAKRNFSAATWEWDKACIIASAYLAATSPISKPELKCSLDQEVVPYWVAIDKHTAQGRAAMKVVAANLRISYSQIVWTSFYLESAKLSALAPSPWWEAEKAWRLKKVGLSQQSAIDMWEKVAPVLKNELARDSKELEQIIKAKNNAQASFFERS